MRGMNDIIESIVFSILVSILIMAGIAVGIYGLCTVAMPVIGRVFVVVFTIGVVVAWPLIIWSIWRY